jgi:acyl-CoA synthetase (AMP-forming)/AMP-acid ligase II
MPDRDVHTLNAMLEQVAHKYPNEELFGVVDGRSCTAGQFHDEVIGVANAYESFGVAPGDRIALLSRSTIKHCAAFFAVAKIGAIPANLHHRDSPGIIAENVDRIDPVVFVYESNFADLVGELPADTLSQRTMVEIDGSDEANLDAIAYEDISDAEGEEPSDPDVSGDDIGMISFTSGTTGSPKPIAIPNRAIIESARNGQHTYQGIVTEDRKLMAYDPPFIAWSAHTFPFTNVGAKTIFAPGFEPSKMLKYIESEEATYASHNTTVWNEALAQGPENYDLSSLKLALYGGEVSSPDLLAKLREKICENLGTPYGATETAGLGGGTLIHSHEIDEKGYESVGRPMLNSDIVVTNAETDGVEELPRGEVGEVLIEGAGVDPKLWHDDGLEEIQVEGYFPSGDLGYMDEDGYLFLEGRIDNLIISKGINIHGEAVESVLQQHPAVTEVALVGVPNEEFGERVTAHIYPEGELTEAEMEQWCKDHHELSDYKRPRTIVIHDEQLPRTLTGKLDRNALTE